MQQEESCYKNISFESVVPETQKESLTEEGIPRGCQGE